MTDSNVTAFNPAARLADETVAQIRAVAQSATPADRSGVQELIARAAKGVKEATVVRLTPAMCAVIFLDHNPHNRDWKPAKTIEYARIMSDAGGWSWTNQGIGFYSDALLEDGQHRLAGAALAGFTWECPCILGVDKSAIVNVDVGSRRFASDAAKLAGINDAKTKQTIIKSAASYLDKSGDVPIPHRTEADIEKAIRSEDRRLDQAIEIGNHSLVGVNSPILKPVLASTMAFLMLRGGWPPQRIAEQLQAFQVPYSQEGEDAPFFVVRKLLLNARESAKRRERLTPLKEVGAVVCAMNAVERGITAVHRKAIRDAVAKDLPSTAYPTTNAVAA
jgi:hypothetical protein